MERITIQAGSVGRAWRVWPDPEPIPPGTVQEGGEHILELTGSDAAVTAELAVEGVRLRALRAPAQDAARWAWEPGFNAGVVEAVLSLGGRRINLSLETDPAARKLARGEFDAMVGEVLEDTLALFAVGGHRKGFGQGSGRPPPLARLEYLRSRADAVVDAVRAIDARPRRSLVAEEKVVPYWVARGATGTEVLHSMRSGRILNDQNDPSVLPPQLRGMLPARIRKAARVSSLDLPEHRMIRACVAQWAGWLAVGADTVATGPADDEAAQDRRVGWASRLRAASRRLAGLLELPLFDGVRDAAPRIEPTPLFRHDPAYRTLHRLAREMELANAAVFGDFLDLPLARTHDLYELWAFLRLARAAVDAAGGRADLSRLFVPSPGGIEVATRAASVTAGPVTIWFQHSFGEFWKASSGVGSMSREMVPDVALTVDGKPGVVILDAKYRVGRDLHDALSSAHMYRDAIVGTDADGKLENVVVGAYLLSPHRPLTAGVWKDVPQPADRIFHPGYRAEFRFGAFTMRPGMGMDAVATVLREALSAVGADPWPIT